MTLWTNSQTLRAMPASCRRGNVRSQWREAADERNHWTVEVPQRVQELLEEFAQVQARPITDPALIQRMRSEATTWINAVHMQHRRVKHPLDEDPWKQEIDLHFLLVALTRLRRAVGLATRVAALQDSLIDGIIEFDGAVPSLSTLRNVAEHFDDYTTGNGREPRIKRHQLQVWSLGEDDNGDLLWRWLDVEFSVDNAHGAATELYRGFLAEADEYLAAPGP